MSEANTITNEIWRPIPLTNGWYEASNIGRIRRLPRTRVGRAGGICPLPFKVMGIRVNCRNGYCSTAINGITHRVHKLVMLAFVGPYPDGMEVNHINGVRTDNRLCNLEYVTRSQNRLHQYHVLKSPHPSITISNETIKEIRAAYAAGEGSYAKLAIRFNMSHWYIRDIVKHRCRNIS